ncbi:MAG: MBL fold metallo-hydrolase [Candidatus Cloacimonadota bacterium]|nr:MBL fold metallo-hydrolase [Candidatus Cloacimonadota bacterium]
MQIKKLNLLEIFETNTYLLWDKIEKVGAVIDPANKAEIIFQESQRLGFEIKYIINTHGHADHIGANGKLKELTNAKICIHQFDNDKLTNPELNFSIFFDYYVISPPADKFLEDNEIVTIGSEQLKVLHTPGHSIGSICLLGNSFLVSGDTLFFEGVGRTDIPGSDKDKLRKSIKEKLFILPERTKVFPGHGVATTIGHEKHNNPFIDGYK